MERGTPSPLMTTGIGSMPHTQLEMALQHALRTDVPFLPQLPMRDAAEFMIPQALAELPGLRYDADGTTTVDVAKWREERLAFTGRLERAVTENPVKLLPPPRSASAWRPFLWEIKERGVPFAKAQLAGPLTVRWAVRTSDGKATSEHPDLDRAMYHLVLGRSIAMVRAIVEQGATPLFFYDEPGLCAFDGSAAQQVLIQELRLALLALRKEGALVGVHCCGNTRWAQVLELPLDFLSIDARVSALPVLAQSEALAGFRARGGRLALGVIPTDQRHSYRVEEIVESVAGQEGLPLADALLTPACGLALRSIPESEQTFDDLEAAQHQLRGRC